MPTRTRVRSGRADDPRPAPAPAWILAGRAWVRGQLRPLEVGIDDDGRISVIGRALRGGPRHDVGDRLILPSATDLHVHFRRPEPWSGSENYGSGTIQAAVGGVGLVGEMPNSEPPAITADRVVELRERGSGRLAVDLLQYGAVTTSRRVPPLARECGAFKLYLSPTTGVEEVPDEELAPLLAAVAATGLPLSVHAEDPAEFRAPEAATNAAEWDHARPLDSELDAVVRVMAAAPPGLRLHIAHVTSAEVAERVRTAGHSCEATPHHLLLAAKEGYGSRFKVNPPLREERVRSELFDRFAAGEIPCLASDHAPHPVEAKDRPFAATPSGMPGVATMLPLLLNESRSGTIELPRLLLAACERPARWFGVPRGRIAVGHRADLLVVDPRIRRPVRGELDSGPTGWSAFEGWEGIFPLEHYLGGERIVEDGEYVGRPTGRVVRPEYAPASTGPVRGMRADPGANFPGALEAL
ncbi:MAG TPA: amidohydrolase family protein [Thermoplasmata archaeon]|nr:amidohydrolase family protein [Thermoplasmata archaeon]